jgi:predicted secreted protein
VSWLSLFAVYFILWWLVLFAMLPFSLRTQDDEGEVTLGTTSSAPKGPHVARAMLRTTVVSLVVVGIYVLVTRGLGLGFDDIPRLVPRFD